MKFFSSSSFSSSKGWPGNEQRRFNHPCGTCPINNPFPALKRRATLRKSLRDCALFAITSILLMACGVNAVTTNTFSDAEIQGRQLAQQLCEAWPTESFTNTGVLKIRDGKAKHSEIPVKCEVVVTKTNWFSDYETLNSTNPPGFQRLVVMHYSFWQYDLSYWTNGNNFVEETFGKNGFSTNKALFIPFAGSDFWLADLGLEFFHWPEQKILKKEFRRNCSCAVLESTNPHPGTNGYSRVDSWIDEESGGIVMARAYDANGRLLKEFLPKEVKKVKGQWQVQSMEIDNVQTGSRTRLELDLKAP